MNLFYAVCGRTNLAGGTRGFFKFFTVRHRRNLQIGTRGFSDFEEILILFLVRLVLCKYFGARREAGREGYREWLEARVSDRPKRQRIAAKDAVKIA